MFGNFRTVGCCRIGRQTTHGNCFVVLSSIIVKISSISKDITVCFSFFLQIYWLDMPNGSQANQKLF